MKVQDVMIRDVISIEPGASLVDAAKRMRDANVGILPVVERGEVRSVITDRDIVVRAIAEQADLTAVQVRDCATIDLMTARPEWDVDQAREAMAEAQVGRLPVVDADKHLVGIVTLSSLALRSREDDETLEAAKQVSRRSVKDPGQPAGAKRPAKRSAKAS
jgi:CBS domain-containing protein